MNLLLMLAAQVFWVWMLVDCLMNESNEKNEKLLWALVLLFTNVLGAVLYFFLRYRERTPREESTVPPSSSTPPPFGQSSIHG